MKMIIAKLRIAAMSSLILFLALIFLGESGPYKFQVGWVQSGLILLSVVLFAFIVVLQVYRFYINYHTKDEAE